MYDLCFAMTGDLGRNARALRQILALAGNGVKLVVLSLDDRPEALPAAVTHHRVSRPARGGARFFWGIHQRFAARLDGISARNYHASDLYVLPACRAAALRRAARFSFDSRELYPEVASTAGRPWVRRFWGAIQSRNLRGVSAVWTVSDGIAEELRKRHAIPSPIVQFNAPSLRLSGATEAGRLTGAAGYLRQETGWPETRPILVHAGQMRAGRGGEHLIRAMQSVKHGGLVFLGYGPEQPRLEALASLLGIESRVAFVAPVPVSEVVPVLAGAQAGVTFLEDSCLNHRLALPNKLFDYLAAGLPVIGSALPEIDRVLTLYNAGLTADPTHVGSLAPAIERVLSDEPARLEWQQGARRAAETFDWDSASERFVAQMAAVIDLPT